MYDRSTPSIPLDDDVSVRTRHPLCLFAIYHRNVFHSNSACLSSNIATFAKENASGNCIDLEMEG